MAVTPSTRTSATLPTHPKHNHPNPNPSGHINLIGTLSERKIAAEGSKLWLSQYVCTTMTTTPTTTTTTTMVAPNDDVVDDDDDVVLYGYDDACQMHEYGWFVVSLSDKLALKTSPSHPCVSLCLYTTSTYFTHALRSHQNSERTQTQTKGRVFPYPYRARKSHDGRVVVVWRAL